MDDDLLDLYVVQWPDLGIIKVGISGNERWRSFRGGARLVATIRAPQELTRAIETETHAQLSEHCPRPYRHKGAAKKVLGGDGAGFSECYMDDGVLVKVIGIASDLIIGAGMQMTVERSAEEGTPLFVAEPTLTAVELWRLRKLCGHCGSCIDYLNRGAPTGEEPYCWANDPAELEADDHWTCDVCGGQYCREGRIRSDAIEEERWGPRQRHFGGQR